jgi:hypothetical protein
LLRAWDDLQDSAPTAGKAREEATAYMTKIREMADAILSGDQRKKDTNQSSAREYV